MRGVDGEEVGRTKASAKEKERCAVRFKVMLIGLEKAGSR